MTLLLNCNSLSKSFGPKQLFRGLSFGISRGDKIGLVGPNGAGKSTLLKVLCDLEHPDSGVVAVNKSVRIGYVPQSSTYPEMPIEELVLKAIRQDHVTQLHEQQTAVTILLAKLGFKDHTQLASTLSGGWKKRLDIAMELINAPDLLLLDEPTNHLDLEGILWLESFLQKESIAFLVTSHDRYFLDRVATSIIELNPMYPQGLFISEGNYSEFVVKREAFLDYQQQCERTLNAKVRSEVDWLRQSPKARTTKASARIQNAERLIDELSEVRTRNRQHKAKIDFEATDRQTRKLLTTKNVSKSLGNRLLFSGVDLSLTQGMRLGIVGANGSGKTTLLRLLAGELEPDKGTIKFADNLRIVYFDQHRQKLNPNDTLRQALSPNSDTVVYRGQHIHVNSWGKRFLFYPDRMDLPIRQLSGGEKARIGIARLMLQPADLLLLDEPTNDLDIPTLETLEESLKEFPGAIAFITHDRALLDSIATCVIGLGFPDKSPLLADHQQWEAFIQQRQAVPTVQTAKSPPIKTLPAEPAQKQKLSYHEKKELESMENAIIATEQEVERLSQLMHTYSDSNKLTELQQTCAALDTAQTKLEQLFHRWQELDSKKNLSTL